MKFILFLEKYYRVILKVLKRCVITFFIHTFTFWLFLAILWVFRDKSIIYHLDKFSFHILLLVFIFLIYNVYKFFRYKLILPGESSYSILYTAYIFYKKLFKDIASFYSWQSCEGCWGYLTIIYFLFKVILSLLIFICFINLLVY